MNKSTSITSAAVVTAIGATLIALANAPFTAALPGEAILAAGASLGLIAVAIADYSRRTQPLALPARLLRPALPAATAYGIKRARSAKNRLAA